MLWKRKFWSWVLRLLQSALNQPRCIPGVIPARNVKLPCLWQPQSRWKSGKPKNMYWNVSNIMYIHVSSISLSWKHCSIFLGIATTVYIYVCHIICFIRFLPVQTKLESHEPSVPLCLILLFTTRVKYVTGAAGSTSLQLRLRHFA